MRLKGPRRTRRLGRVHYPDVVGAKIQGDVGFARPLQQALEELALLWASRWSAPYHVGVASAELLGHLRLLPLKLHQLALHLLDERVLRMAGNVSSGRAIPLQLADLIEDRFTPDALGARA